MKFCELFRRTRTFLFLGIELQLTTYEKTPIPYPVASLPISKGTGPCVKEKQVQLGSFITLGKQLWHKHHKSFAVRTSEK